MDKCGFWLFTKIEHFPVKQMFHWYEGQLTFFLMQQHINNIQNMKLGVLCVFKDVKLKLCKSSILGRIFIRIIAYSPWTRLQI